MSKHTPGPWELEEWGFDYGPTGDFSIYQSRSKTPRMPIACVQLPFNGKQTEANARLIAAAPDMLAAIQAYSAWADKTMCKDKELCAIRDQMRAAIAKATGVTQ